LTGLEIPARSPVILTAPTLGHLISIPRITVTPALRTTGDLMAVAITAAEQTGVVSAEAIIEAAREARLAVGQLVGANVVHCMAEAMPVPVRRFKSPLLILAEAALR